MKFLLTQVQAKKLHDAIKFKRKCTLTLSNSKKNPGGIDLPLSEKQIKLLSDGRPHKITFSDKSGGFFAALTSLLPSLSNAFNIGSAVASIGKTIYDAATGRGIKVRRVRGKGVGGFIPIESPLAVVLPSLAMFLAQKMAQSGKGLAESAKNIFLSPQFLSLIDQEIRKQTKGQGLMLGPPRHYPY